MDSTEELSQSYLERPYTVFLFKALGSIYEKWVGNNPEGALTEALKLVVTLPTNVKEKLTEEKKRIEIAIANAYRRHGSDYYTRQQNRNREAKRVAHRELEPFMDKMTRLLDQKGWLERGAIKPRFQTKRKLKA